MRGPRHRTPLPAITIGDYLAAVAARGPRCRSPVGDEARRLTYAELALDVERVACGLLALDIAKGDRIAIWAPESTEWALVQLAAARAGAVLVILDGDWTTEQLLAVFREAKRSAVRDGRLPSGWRSSRPYGSRAGHARAPRDDRRRSVRRAVMTSPGASYSSRARPSTRPSWRSERPRSTRTTRSRSSTDSGRAASSKQPRSHIGITWR